MTTEQQRTSGRERASTRLLSGLPFVALVFLTILGTHASTAQDQGRLRAVAPAPPRGVDLQGHRGARGLVPENSIPSVLAALNLGVETLELDVVISRDNQVVVSHEPWMSPTICRTPTGEAVSEETARGYNIYAMDFAEVAGFDCGSRGHPSFPRQRPTAVWKPLLETVVRIADGYALSSGNRPPRYNVEIKSAPENDGIYHPAPEVFARLVYDVLSRERVLGRSNIQSFDPRALRAVRAIDPRLPIALLVSNDDGFDANLDRLGFVPAIYSPDKALVDEALMQSARASGVRVIPWTVNTREEMERLLMHDVDGIITDYPGIGRKAIDEYLRTQRAN